MFKGLRHEHDSRTLTSGHVVALRDFEGTTIGNSQDLAQTWGLGLKHEGLGTLGPSVESNLRTVESDKARLPKYRQPTESKSMLMQESCKPVPAWHSLRA